MMKLTILSALVASAVAFAPSKQQQPSSTSLSASFDTELGVQAPLGFFDPLGMLADGDQDTFNRLRETELKHGRISMLAVTGYLVTKAGIRLPGEIGSGKMFSDIPSGFPALSEMPAAGLGQILLFIFFMEVGVMTDVTGNAEFIGDFRNGAIDFGWDKYDEATKLKKRSIELNNGRAAQMGILGLMVHEQMGVSILPGGV